MPTPCKAQSERSEVNFALSDSELAELWVLQLRQGADTSRTLAEFNRRFWLRQEENAAEGRPLELYPWHRDERWHRKGQVRIGGR